MKNNLVAKHMHKFNKGKVFNNRKKRFKNGYKKHKSFSKDENDVYII
jgi:hypothetical protein